MTALDFQFQGQTLTALPSGALYDAGRAVLCVSDLHLCKSERIARRSGTLLPPYETRETLGRLAEDVATTDPKTVICLGDSFDDLDAARALDDDCRTILMRLQAGRTWIWIEGNHDPGPVDLGGTYLFEVSHGPLTYRHIAQTGAQGEISGHYHPKLSLPGAGRARPCFCFDINRLILPAYGAYTGGLNAQTPVLRDLFAPEAYAILIGRKAILTRLI